MKIRIRPHAEGGEVKSFQMKKDNGPWLWYPMPSDGEIAFQCPMDAGTLT